jgi:hypothetical protein
MLFIFESEGLYSFWMKGMRFPLDMVWINAECAVVDITKEVPPPDPARLHQTCPLTLPRNQRSMCWKLTLERLNQQVYAPETWWSLAVVWPRRMGVRLGIRLRPSASSARVDKAQEVGYPGLLKPLRCGRNSY